MITYPPRADQKGFTFQLLEYVRVDGRNYTGVSLLLKESGGTVEYEVVKVRKHKKDRWIKDVKIASKGDHYLPSSNDWGVYGWTYSTMEQAEAKVKELTEGIRCD